MAKDTISTLMVAQHALIETLFTAFRDELGPNPSRAKSFLMELSWEARKHFFVEEQAIFNLLPWRDSEILEITEKLKKDHVVILEIIGKSLADLGLNNMQTSGFTALMKNHLEIEEKKLYPMLDEKLNDEEKRHIISRINEIPFTPNQKLPGE